MLHQVGDGICDNYFESNFNCSKFDYDGGDCVQQAQGGGDDDDGHRFDEDNDIDDDDDNDDPEEEIRRRFVVR